MPILKEFDPDLTLIEIETIRATVAEADPLQPYNFPTVWAQRLAEAVGELFQHISTGGALPKAWQPKEPEPLWWVRFREMRGDFANRGNRRWTHKSHLTEEAARAAGDKLILEGYGKDNVHVGKMP